jgi:hypothetical protein
VKYTQSKRPWDSGLPFELSCIPWTRETSGRYASRPACRMLVLQESVSTNHTSSVYSAFIVSSPLALQVSDSYLLMRKGKTFLNNFPWTICTFIFFFLSLNHHQLPLVYFGLFNNWNLEFALVSTFQFLFYKHQVASPLQWPVGSCYLGKQTQLLLSFVRNTLCRKNVKLLNVKANGFIITALVEMFQDTPWSGVFDLFHTRWEIKFSRCIEQVVVVYFN